jgi:hypothetical protein
MASDLKPDLCPLCGNADIYVAPDEIGSGGQWVPPVHVGCKPCGLDLVDLIGDGSRNAAIAAWNHRQAEARATTAEAERDEARRERDAALALSRLTASADEVKAFASQAVRIAELEKALEPFAGTFDDIVEYRPELHDGSHVTPPAVVDDGCLIHIAHVTVGDFRRARTTLAAQQDQKGEGE